MPESDATTFVTGLLRHAGLLDDGEQPVVVPLAGGVSGDTWRATTALGDFVVKAALSRLRVAAEWHAPVERAETEARWFATVSEIVPEAVPRLVASVAARHALVTAFVDAPVWKQDLIDGRVDVDVARQVGDRIARIHRATANDDRVAADFADYAAFHALRVEPFLLYPADQIAAVRAPLLRLADDLSTRRDALVHGDVSPKNILVAAGGPIIIDAECAVYGDPAFDPAFCLTHLLLKSLWLSDHRAALVASAAALVAGYQPPPAVERRIAHLVAALLLARVAGRSPVEYLSDAHRRIVRDAATDLLLNPKDTMTDLTTVWQDALA